MIKQQYIVNAFKAAFFLLITYLVIFNHIGERSIRLWDESRVVMNAYEMYYDGFSLVPTFERKPDMWNVKPPILIWLQVASTKLFGMNEVALRLPSAIGGFLTCLLLLWISIKYLKSYWFGMFAVIVLLTSKGFIFDHKIRYAEYEGILVFFMMLYVFGFFLYTELKDEKQKRFYFNIGFLGLTLAVLTKGIAGFLLTPGIFLYILLKKQLLPTLKRKQTYINLVIFLGFVIGYYVLREQYNEGYIAMVWEEEVAGRYKGDKGLVTNFFYYFDHMYWLNFQHWYLLMISGTFIGIFWKQKPFLRNLTIYSFMVSMIFFLIVSKSGTKYHWYDMPAYPLFALLAAITLYWIAEGLKQYQGVKNETLRKVLPYIIVLVYAFPAFTFILSEEVEGQRRNDRAQFDVSYFLRDAYEGRHKIDGYKFAYDGYFPNHLFYIKKLKDEKNINVEPVNPSNLKEGDLAIVFQNHAKRYIRDNYDFEVSWKHKSFIIYKINGAAKN